MKARGYQSTAEEQTNGRRDVFGLLELVFAICVLCAVGASIVVVFFVAMGGGPIP